MFAFPVSAYRPKYIFVQFIDKYFKNTDTLSDKKIPSIKTVLTQPRMYHMSL